MVRNNNWYLIGKKNERKNFGTTVQSLVEKTDHINKDKT